MNNFDISDYLHTESKRDRRGQCKRCLKTVTWTRRTVASHKRVSCINATEEEKKLFAGGDIRYRNSLQFDENESMSSAYSRLVPDEFQTKCNLCLEPLNECDQENIITTEIKQRIFEIFPSNVKLRFRQFHS